MWENKEVKGQRQKKVKVDPQLELKSTAAKKIDLTIKVAADDMKLTPWRSMQGIKDEQLLVSVLSRVVAKELSLEEMVTKFNKSNTFVLNICFVFFEFMIANVCLCFSSHKVYMKIQEVMMKQLGCLAWDQVTEEYPITSSYNALSEYFIAFKNWVSITYS